MIGLSLFATNISCYHLVGLAENGFNTGLLYGNFEWMAVFTLVLLSLFFVPFYLRSKVATLPDFLEKRFDRSSRDWLAVLSILSSIVIHITFSFVAGGAVLHSLFGWDEYTGDSGDRVRDRPLYHRRRAGRGGVDRDHPDGGPARWCRRHHHRLLDEERRLGAGGANDRFDG